jgi:hypothetical protein
MRASVTSSSAGGAGLSPGRTGGITASEMPDLRPRAIEDAPHFHGLVLIFEDNRMQDA